MNEFQFPDSRSRQPTSYEAEHQKPQHYKIAAIKLFREATGAPLSQSVYSFEASFGEEPSIKVSNAQIGMWIKAYYAHLAKQERTPEPDPHEDSRLKRRKWLDQIFTTWKSDYEKLVHFEGHAELTTSSLPWWMAAFGKHGLDPTSARTSGGDWVLVIRYEDIKDENL